MPARTLANAQLQCKCPRCREGDIFTHRLGNILKFSSMNKRCPICGADFEPEPGFYFGAMFVSYAISVVIFIVVGVTLYIFFRPSDTVYLICIVAVAIIFTPFSFRYSRVLFLYWFGGYHFEPPA
jgi:uncharacterized protein (DUF983 family)